MISVCSFSALLTRMTESVAMLLSTVAGEAHQEEPGAHCSAPSLPGLRAGLPRGLPTLLPQSAAVLLPSPAFGNHVLPSGAE